MAGWLHRHRGHVPDINIAVGLKSVQQLTLSAQFSGFQGITEGYNLATVDNPNDQKHIPGFD